MTKDEAEREAKKHATEIDDKVEAHGDSDDEKHDSAEHHHHHHHHHHNHSIHDEPPVGTHVSDLDVDVHSVDSQSDHTQRSKIELSNLVMGDDSAFDFRTTPDGFTIEHHHET